MSENSEKEDGKHPIEITYEGIGYDELLEKEKEIHSRVEELSEKISEHEEKAEQHQKKADYLKSKKGKLYNKLDLLDELKETLERKEEENL